MAHLPSGVHTANVLLLSSIYLKLTWLIGTYLEWLLLCMDGVGATCNHVANAHKQ